MKLTEPFGTTLALLLIVMVTAGAAATPNAEPPCSLPAACEVAGDSDWVCNDLGNACVIIHVDPKTHELELGWRHYEVDPLTSQAAYAGLFVDGEAKAECKADNVRNQGCLLLGGAIDPAKCYRGAVYLTEALFASGVELRQSFGAC